MAAGDSVVGQMSPVQKRQPRAQGSGAGAGCAQASLQTRVSGSECPLSKQGSIAEPIGPDPKEANPKGNQGAPGRTRMKGRQEAALSAGCPAAGRGVRGGRQAEPPAAQRCPRRRRPRLLPLVCVVFGLGPQGMASLASAGAPTRPGCCVPPSWSWLAAGFGQHPLRLH